MRYAFLLLLFCVAAGPMYEVQIQFTPDVDIGQVNEVYGDHVDGLSGSWILRSLDRDGLVVAETIFDPYEIGLDLSPQVVDEIWLSVPAPVSVGKLVVLDNQGDIVATWNKPATCGDGICSDAEGAACLADCPLEQEIAEAQEELQTPATGGFASWKIWVIAGCVLLMIVLIILLIHVNRKKPNPVQMDYERL